jgi:hypothetical protein
MRMDRLTIRRISSRSNVAGDAGGATSRGVTDAPVGNG